jgi:copper(I)-binding protein
MRYALPVLFALLLISGLDRPAAAADLQVHHPWARASLGAHQTGAAYMGLVNVGEGADRLVAVSTPAAKRAELHEHSMDDQGVMKMRPVEAIDVAAKSETHLQPGGLHVMLMGLAAPLTEGDSFPMTLRFENAGEIEVTVAVLAPAAMGPAHHGGHGSGHQHGEGHAHQHGHGKAHQDGDGHAHQHGHGKTHQDGDGHAHQHGHGKAHQHGQGHGHHQILDLPADDDAPSLSLAAEPDAAGGWNLHVMTENFRFAPENVNSDHQAGEGHAHLYVDGKKVARLYGPWYHLGKLMPGRHELKVTLNANDHRPLAVDGAPLAAVVTVEAKATDP